MAARCNISNNGWVIIPVLAIVISIGLFPLDSVFAKGGESKVSPEFAEATYTWLVKKNKAIGCIETIHVQKESIPGCFDLPFAVLGCAVYESNYVIDDLKKCREKLPAKAYWLDEGKPPVCTNFSEFETEDKPPKKHRIALDYSDPEKCGHGWVKPGCRCDFSVKGNYLFHPLAKFGFKDLIPEIMNLAEGAEIPKEVYEKYDSKRVGMTLVYRKSQRQESKEDLKDTFDYQDNTEIRIAFKHEILDKIIKNGFLNQHQIGTSEGCLCPKMRAGLEDLFFDTVFQKDYVADPEGKVNLVRPKYSYLVFPDLEEKDNPFGSYAPGYGNVLAVLQPKVKDRATFTWADSLSSGARGDRVMSFRFRSPKNPKQIKKEKGGLEHYYMEAQIYGELTMGDVSHFIVNCESFRRVPNDVISELSKLGKKVYGCQESGEGSYGPKTVKKGRELTP